MPRTITTLQIFFDTVDAPFTVLFIKPAKWEGYIANNVGASSNKLPPIIQINNKLRVRQPGIPPKSL